LPGTLQLKQCGLYWNIRRCISQSDTPPHRGGTGSSLLGGGELSAKPWPINVTTSSPSSCPQGTGHNAIGGRSSRISAQSPREREHERKHKRYADASLPASTTNQDVTPLLSKKTPKLDIRVDQGPIHVFSHVFHTYFENRNFVGKASIHTPSVMCSVMYSTPYFQACG